MPSENICWPSFHKQMGIISQDKNWVDGCAFQQSVKFKFIFNISNLYLTKII